jgi:hypothetical protein
MKQRHIYMSAFDAKTKLEALYKHLEALTAWAKLLIAGHVAGLSYCLFVLKGDGPRYNVGVFIWLFGVGLLLAGTYFLVLTILKVEVPQAILAQEHRPRPIRSAIMEWLGLIGIWGSAACFLIAPVLFMYRFASPHLMEGGQVVS